MEQLKTALFDFDGVIADTEKIYDTFWNEMGRRYQVPQANFAQLIKGTTVTQIINRYFSHYPQDVQKKIIKESNNFDYTLPIPPLPGSVEFVKELKRNGVKIGIVTSSDDKKMERALRLLDLEDTFDTMVTANRITRSKPDPMCYLLGASDLQTDPEQCLVFEDSMAGIEAGNRAGMRVIGLSTTNPAEAIRDKVYRVISNFKGLTIKDYIQWQQDAPSK